MSERDVRRQAEARVDLARRLEADGHLLLWCGSSVECSRCGRSGVSDADGARGELFDEPKVCGTKRA